MIKYMEKNNKQLADILLKILKEYNVRKLEIMKKSSLLLQY